MNTDSKAPGAEARETINDVITSVRRLLVKLERLVMRDGRTLDQEILDCLADTGPLHTLTISRLIRRDRNRVFAMLKLLRDAGRITRRPEPDNRWEIRNEA